MPDENPPPQDEIDPQAEKTAQAKLDKAKRIVQGLILVYMTPDEIRHWLNKLESNKHQIFE